jgi:hypothetical protein
MIYGYYSYYIVVKDSILDSIHTVVLYFLGKQHYERTFPSQDDPA